ncbi:methyltransferase-like protein 17, mitochondrial [Sinocyclocheilus grahami]|uniref:methyltransferase-like protein 17, mitochondrial n=1 Tax=Sinocyclocheilus grahami TaxID=75366 RepID=UPI0007AD4FA9|nr:PREDICTED: methyltransferase-like protein 17, mitochondrial [Sinocyclocheilus grahami]
MYLLGSRMYVKCTKCHVALCLKDAHIRCQSSAAHLEQDDILKGGPHRKHPGVTNLKTVRLPEQLQVAAQSVLKRATAGADVKSLSEKAHKLSNFLWSRKRVIETSQLREKAVLLENTFLEQERDIHTDGIDRKLEARIRERVLSELRRTTYRRTPLRYDEDLGLVYMAARLVGGYAAVLRALNEIKKRDPVFVPYSLLDFGSGTCSGGMNTLAEQLLSGGNEVDNPVIKQVYFRQFLPVSPKVQFDLVIAAFSLSELATLDERVNVIFTLWRKTNSYLNYCFLVQFLVLCKGIGGEWSQGWPSNPYGGQRHYTKERRGGQT